MATEGSGARVPHPTATSGMPAASSVRASAAAVSGAITMMPSTDWPRNHSTASGSDLRSKLARLAIATE